MGPVALLRWGALLMGIPLAAMLLLGTQAAALAGLFAIGLGVSNGVPLMFSAAGRQPDTPPGPAIGAVSSLGSLGFLAGPPFIGVLADAVSLPWALATIILGAVVVFALARRAVGRTLPAPAPRRAPARAGAGLVTFAAVISDLDGVLVDSVAPTVRSWRAWGERHGLDGAAIQARNHGRPARAVIAEHVAPEQVDDDTAFLAHAETDRHGRRHRLPGRG